MSRSNKDVFEEAFKGSEPAPVEESDKNPRRTGGRRKSDRIQPLLDKLVGILSAESSREAFFNISLDLQQVFRCEAVRVYSIDRLKNQLFTCNFIGNKLSEIRLDLSQNQIPCYVAQTGNFFIVPKTSKEKYLSKYKWLHKESLVDPVLNRTVDSIMVLPLISQDQLMGVLEVANSEADQGFVKEDLELAHEAGKKICALLEKFRKEEIEEKQHTLLQIIKDVRSLEDFISKATPLLLELFESEVLHCLEYSSEQAELSLLTTHNIPSHSRFKLPLESHPILNWIVREKKGTKIESINDVKQTSRFGGPSDFPAIWNKKLGVKVQSFLACPIMKGSSVVAMIQVLNQLPSRVKTLDDINRLEQICEQLSQALYSTTSQVSVSPSKFGYLVEKNIITPEELSQIISKARKTHEEIETLLQTDLDLNREIIGEALGKHFNLPYFGYDPSIFLDPHLLEGLNQNYLVKNLWVPLATEDEKTTILVNDAEDVGKLHGIRQAFPKKKLEFKIGLKQDILEFLNYGNMSSEGEGGYTKEVGLSEIMEALQDGTLDQTFEELHDEDNVDAISESDSNIVRFVNKMIVDAFEMRASDIHVEPGTGGAAMIIRFRIDGDCQFYQTVPKIYKQALVSRIKVMAKLDISERRLPQDGKIKVKYGKKEIDLRVAIGPTFGSNEDVVLRLLRSQKPLPLEQLNFLPRNLNLIQSEIKKPYGFVLVVGPTGSGKTTTLHSILSHLNLPIKKIWTAEDPVEITQEGIRQLQVHPKIGLDFSSAFRFFLRGDPDIIMIGEMRDAETMNMAMEASLSGHLVLSTLHTNSAPETISRLLTMGMDPYVFADSLLMIVAQRLVKTFCPSCTEVYEPNQEEMEILKNQFGPEAYERQGITPENITMNQSKGCEKCNNTGFFSRMGLHEVLQSTHEIKNLIVEKAPVEIIRKQALQDGMTTLKQDGILKVLQGYTDFKQVLNVCLE